MHHPLIVNHANTAQAPLAGRCEYWENYSSDWLIALKCTPYDESGLIAQQKNVKLPDLALSFIQGNRHVIERTRDLIRFSPKDSVFISFDFACDAFFYQGKSCKSVGRNDMVIYHTDSPYLFGFKGQMQQLILEIPTEWVKTHFKNGVNEPIKLSPIDSTHQLLIRTLARYGKRFLQAPSLDQVEACYEQVSGLLQHILSYADMTKQKQSPGLVYVLTAKQYIAENLGSRLDNDTIAMVVGLSSRHLNRLFVEQGQTIQQYIQRQRLQRAYRLLTTKIAQQLSIEEIAYRTGFNSLAHFSRLFKQNYGSTPSQIKTYFLGV